MTELANAPTIVDDPRNTGGAVARGNDGVDPRWLKEHAEKRREEFAAARRAMTDDLRARRRQQSLGTRVDRCATRLARLSNLPARQITPGAQSSEESKGGRRPAGEAHAEIDREVRVLVAAIEALERALDVEEGLAPEGAAQLMATHEKDRELFTLFAGVPGIDVARDHREQGSKTTIYRRRLAAGFNSLGLDKETGLPPTAERVTTAVLELSRTMPRAA